jgi:hypothetical protein
MAARELGPGRFFHDNNERMQTTGYVNIRGTGEGWKKKVRVLVRQGKNCRYLRLRKSGKLNTHFIDEELYLNQSVEEGEDHVDRLLKGETICL